MLQLNDPSLLVTGVLIDGEFKDLKNKFDITNPATGEVIASVSDADVDITKRAIDSAHSAQKLWAKTPAKTRSQVLRRLFDLVMKNQDDLARIITAEMGKPFAEAKGEVAYGASYIEWFAEEAKRMYGDIIPAPSVDKRIFVVKQPVGVVGSITPWNFPNAMLARKLAPALAAGCSVVARPAELTPLSALALGELAIRAGVPRGVLNIIPSSDASSIGKELCSNSKVAKITFTGSTRVGKILMGQCAQGIKKMSLELGGNAPFIVFDDANIDAAVEGAMIAKYRNAGQTCVCANRIFVHQAVHDEFVEKFVKAVSVLKVGDGMKDGVNIGPLVSNAAKGKVEDHLFDAISQGAKIVLGGKPHELGKTFFEPSVITGVTKDMAIFREETFGPVAPIFKFETDEEVMSMANDTEFGLAGYFFSKDMARCFKVAEELEVGMVGINTGMISNEAAPFGGMKQSGMGREGSKYGLDDYTEIKYMCFGEVV